MNWNSVPLRKAALFVALALAVVAFYWLGGDRYLSYHEVSTKGAQIRWFIASHPFESVIAYVCIYLFVAVLCLPGVTLFLTMVGGGLFGFVQGSLLAEVSSTLGAFLAFLLVRYLFRDAVARRFEGRGSKVRDKLKRHGTKYILIIRITMAFPYFLLNPLLALTSVSPWTFLWTTAVGILPSTIFYSYLGYRIGLMGVEGTFKLFPILVMLPLAVALIVSCYRMDD